MLPFNRNGILTVSSKYVKQFFNEKEAKELILDFYNGRQTQKEEELMRYFGLGQVIDSIKDLHPERHR